jgi:hypothetical protein
VDGIAPVRHQNTTHPADWQRLKDMFAEAGAVLPDNPWTIQAPSVPHGVDGIEDSTVDLHIRSGLDFPVAREAKWRPLSERTVTAFTSALEQSSLTRAMARIALGDAHTGGSDAFSPRGLNRSRTVTLKWWCAPGSSWPADLAKPVEATARLQMPGSYGQVGQNLHVEIDVAIRHSAQTEIIRRQSPNNPMPMPPWRITVPQLGDLIDTMLTTLSSDAIVEPLANLAGIDPIAVAQPTVLHMVTARPVTEVLDPTDLRPIPEAGVSKGAHLLADPACDLADEGDRREQVAAWLTQIALDAGLLGMEQLLHRLAEDPAGT